MNKDKIATNFVKKYNNFKDYNFFCHLRFSQSSTKLGKDIFGVIGENSYAKEKLRKIYFPNENDMLGRKLEYNNQISLKEILDWDLHIIKYFATELNEYVTLRFKYEQYFFKEQYLEAWKLLDNMEKKLGFSLWLIEQQFSVLYCSNSENEAEEIFSYYKNQADSLLTKNILCYLKWRKDVNVNFDKYTNYVDKLLQNYEKNSITEVYLKNKLSIRKEGSQNLYKLALQVDETFSLIDLYETVIDALFFLLHEGNDSIDINLLKQISDTINDNRWNSMLAYKIGDTSLKTINEDKQMVFKLLEYYSSCNWYKAEQMLKSYLEKHPEDFMLNYIYIKCLLFQDKPVPTLNRLFESLYTLYTMPDEQIAIKIEFDYFLKKYYGTRWQYKIFSIIERKVDGVEDGFMEYMSVCYDEHITPLFCKILPKKNIKKFLNSMEEVCPIMTKILSIQYGVCNEPLSMNNIIKGYYIKICNSSLNVDYYALVETGRKALNYLDSREISNDHAAYYYYKERICRQLFPALLKLEYIKEAIDLYGHMYIERKMLVKRLNVKSLVDKIEALCSNDEKDISFMSTIYAPIIYHCWYGTEKPEKIIIGYRNFLYYNNVSYLTDWMSQLTNISKAEVYFLYNVCTEKLLERDYQTLEKFGTETEIRIFILNFLAEKDTIGKKKYMEELNAIYSKQKLEESVQLLNQDRIHIEIDKLYSEMEVFLKKEFEKYNLLQLLQAEVHVEVSEGIDANEEEKKQTLSIKINKEYLHYQSENAFYLYIIKTIIYNYLMNGRYGLNTYLGTRIRHNYCQQYLFSVFEKWNLLSKKEKDNSIDYVINNYWEQAGNIKENNEIIRVLNEFSRNMNNELQIIKNEWIQIKSKHKKDGLFDYDNMDNLILNYTLIVKNSYEIVYYTTVEKMNKKTAELLETIREKLGETLKNFFDEQLSELKTKLRSLQLSDEISQDIFFKIQKCEEELPNTIANFQNIFNFENICYSDFIMQKVVDCNLAIFQKLYPDNKKNILVTKISANKFIKGSFFPDWIDIIGIIFQNAKEHSKYQDFEKAYFKINICYIEINGNNWMHINTSNYVNESLEKIQVMDKKIGVCIYNIHKNKFLEESIKEEGSGLYKIARIIKYNFGVEAEYEAKIQNYVFELDIKLPINSMERDNENIMYRG